ncbi:MAG: toll/interleukin-1 receptor domain-containing protein [Cytophagales bacterium]|nr:toll/interleukin-1 receptor domain-containing protein [Cytophagales bacterium]
MSLPKIFISYSESSKEDAETLQEQVIKIGSDYVTCTSNDRSTNSISRDRLQHEMSDISVLILLVSKDSLSSEWFRVEFSVAIDQMWERQIYLMPVYLEDIVGQSYPTFFNYFEFVDARVNSDFEYTARKAIDLACREEGPPLPADFFKGKHNLHSYQGTSTEASNKKMLEVYDDRLTKLIDSTMSGVEKRLSEVINAIAAKEHVLSPITIKFREQTVHKHVWVLTRFLYNDLNVEEIIDGVNANLKESRKYVYFIPKASDLAIDRAREYAELPGKKEFEGLYKFIEIDEDLVMPFEELVIYDPMESPRTWGYVQYSFQNDNQVEDLFLRLDKSLLTELVAKLKSSYKEPVMKFMFPDKLVADEEPTIKK